MTSAVAPFDIGTPDHSRPRYVLALLVIIILLALFLRVYRLGQSPPGLSQDEAVNAWNAWCLLKTGTDQHGVSWPLFYMRAFGGNNSPFFIYAMLPFQAVGGMNILTTRLPGVCAGVMAVLLEHFKFPCSVYRYVLYESISYRVT
jgi:4-amino-4-deoxy-L-arabinose transferase-like glycosyltransferase